MLWWFIGIVNPGKIFDLAPASFRVNSFCVASFTFLQRSVNKHLYESMAPDHVSDIVTSCSIRAHSCAHNGSAVPHNLCRDKANAANIQIAILPAKSKPAREMRTCNIAVKNCNFPAMLLQEHCQHFCGSRLACPAQSCEPYANSLLVTRWIFFEKNLGHFRTGKP